MDDELLEEVPRIFEQAAERMRANTGLSLTNEQKLDLYGYYKQAKEGHCNVSKPGFFDFAGRAKWEAWNKLGDLSKELAMAQYISLVNELDPGWETKEISVGEVNKVSSMSGGGGPVVSRMADRSEDIPENQKNLFDWCKEGQIKKLEECLTQNHNIDAKDKQGMALLHWACDRGNVDIVKSLIKHGAQANIQDSEGQTPLHYAASCGHNDVVLLLLTSGADKNISDNNGEIAQDVSDPNSSTHFFAVPVTQKLINKINSPKHGGNE